MSSEGGSSEVSGEQLCVVTPPVFFQIRGLDEEPLSVETIENWAREIIERRGQLAAKPHIVNAVGDQDALRFFVLVFAVGCLLHQPQQLEGFSILPLHQGFSHRNIWEIVNTHLQSIGLGQLPFQEKTERAFAASTPVFVISYPVVVAKTADAALDYCRDHAARIFSILGIGRGQKPRAFGYVASQYETSTWWHYFDFPGYRGNYLADFDPASTANLIEHLLPRLESNPFSRLILSTYGDATAEQEFGFALLRYWSVLELISERKVNSRLPIFHPDGTQILNSKGNAEMSNSKHGKVYSYLLGAGAFEEFGSYSEGEVQKQFHIGSHSNPNVSPETEVFSLWQMVRAAYAIRNAIAHEGRFDSAKAEAGDEHQRLAARLLNAPSGPDILRFIRNQAHLAVLREA